METVHAPGPGVIGIGVDPQVGIGQRALLGEGERRLPALGVRSIAGRGLAEFSKALGGLRALAVSHRHFHTVMVDWGHTFNYSVRIHADNRPWVMRPGSHVQFWTGESTELARGMTWFRCGGHFPGSAALHHDREGGGLFTGDTFHVNPDRCTVGLMYVSLIASSVSAATVRQVVRAVERFEICPIYRQ
jgi:hypothetical protein